VARRRTAKKKPFPGDPSDPHGLKAWVLRYLEAIRAQHLSKWTLRVREETLRLFVVWCHERGLTRPTSITRPILLSYQRHLFYYRRPSGKPLAISTQHGRLVAVRALFKWLTRENVLLSNPASELDLPRLVKRLPKHVLTEEEAEQILSLPDLEDPLGVRDRAVLEVFYATGLRRMEVAKLEVFDLEQDRQSLRVREGKGRQDRVVPLGERAAAWCERYLLEVRPHLLYGSGTDALFLTREGQAYGLSGLSRMVRGYVARAELGKTGSCHLFRHTAATLMLENGADVRYVQEMLGHKSLETTQLYTRVTIRKLREVHAATHPGARVRKPEGPPESSPEAGEAGA